jgi:hypothetical protein
MAVNIHKNDIKCSERCDTIYLESMNADATKKSQYETIYNKCLHTCMLPKELNNRFIIMVSFFKNLFPSLIDNNIIEA